MLISYSRIMYYELKETVSGMIFSVNNALDKSLGLPVCFVGSDRKVFI